MIGKSGDSENKHFLSFLFNKHISFKLATDKHVLRKRQTAKTNTRRTQRMDQIFVSVVKITRLKNFSFVRKWYFSCTRWGLLTVFNIRNIPNLQSKRALCNPSSAGAHSKYYTGVNTACFTFCLFDSLTLFWCLGPNDTQRGISEF